MTRLCIEKFIKAKSIEHAVELFSKKLSQKGYEWVGEEMKACVTGGYYCMSNALHHNLQKGVINSPETSDWSYYWAIENIDGNSTWYAWFIERS